MTRTQSESQPVTQFESQETAPRSQKIFSKLEQTYNKKSKGRTIALNIAAWLSALSLATAKDAQAANPIKIDTTPDQTTAQQVDFNVEKGYPQIVVTTKIIKAVSNPVTLLPSGESIPADATIVVVAAKNGAYIVEYNGEEYFVNRNDLQEIDVIINEESDEVESQEAETKPIETRQTTSNVNKRSGPGTSFGTLGVLPEGTTVIIVEDNGSGWAKVSVEGEELEFYLSTDFLDNPIFTEQSVGTQSETPPAISQSETITTTSQVSNTDSTSEETPIHNPEGIGGSIEDEILLAEAREAIGINVVKVMSTVHDQPIALNSKGEIIGYYQSLKWENYTFPEDIKVSQASKALEEVQKIFPNATDAKFSVGVIYIQDENSNEIARVENGVIIPELEDSLIKFINRDPNLKPNLDQDAVIVKTINGTPIAEVNGVFFLYSPKGWLFTTPDIEAQLNVAPLPVVSEQDSGEYIVHPDEIAVTLDQGYDFEGRATLDENAEQVILEWFAEAFAQSGVLSPIMGSTKEDVLAYLRGNNYQLPPQAKLPSQLPRVFADVSTHNYVKFISPEFPINLHEIKLQFVWNDEIDKYKDYEQYLVWSGNNPGISGCGMFVDNDGKLHIIAIVERDDFYDDPVKLESAATKGVYRAIAMMAHFQGEELAGGDEYAFISAFREADSLPKNLINTIYQIIAAKTP